MIPIDQNQTINSDYKSHDKLKFFKNPIRRTIYSNEKLVEKTIEYIRKENYIKGFNYLNLLQNANGENFKNVLININMSLKDDNFKITLNNNGIFSIKSNDYDSLIEKTFNACRESESIGNFIIKRGVSYFGGSYHRAGNNVQFNDPKSAIDNSLEKILNLKSIIREILIEIGFNDGDKLNDKESVIEALVDGLAKKYEMNDGIKNDLRGALQKQYINQPIKNARNEIEV